MVPYRSTQDMGADRHLHSLWISSQIDLSLFQQSYRPTDFVAPCPQVVVLAYTDVSVVVARIDVVGATLADINDVQLAGTGNLEPKVALESIAGIDEASLPKLVLQLVEE